MWSNRLELVSTNWTGAKCEHIPVPGKSKQEDAEFEASLSYTVRKTLSQKPMRREGGREGGI